MPSFVEEKGFTVECSKEDVTQYMDSLVTTPGLSFIEYIKDKMKIEEAQGIDLIVKNLDLREVDLSNGIFSTKGSADYYSTITFEKVTFPTKEDSLFESTFLGAIFENTSFQGVPIAKFIINEDTTFAQNCRLSNEQTNHITTTKKDLHAHREGKGAKIIADLLKKDLLAEAQSLIEQSWGQFGESFFKKDEATLMRESVEKLFSNAFKGSNVFEKFLSYRDQSELKSMKAALKTFSETIKEQFDSITKDKSDKTKAIIGSEAAMELMKKLNAFKKAIAAKDTSELLNTTKPLDKKPIITGITQSAIEALGPYIGINLSGSRSAWPNIPGNKLTERKRDLELKKEGLEFLQTLSRTAAGAGILASAYRGGVSGAIGGFISTVVAGTGEVTLAKVMSEIKIDTPENTQKSYEKFNNQFGDKLLEIIAAKKAIEKSLWFMTNNELTQIFLNNLLGRSESSFSLQGTHRIMANVSRAIVLQNISTAYGFISAEKSKDPRKRLRPGSEEFNLKINKEMIDIPRVFIYAASSATLTTAFILTAIFAGPLIAPFVAAIGALSTLPLLAIGATVTATIGYIGYKIHTSIKFASIFQKKAKAEHSRTGTSASAQDQPQQETKRGREPAQALGVQEEKQPKTSAHHKENHAPNSLNLEEEKDEFFDAEDHEEKQPIQPALPAGSKPEHDSDSTVEAATKKTHVKNLEAQRSVSTQKNLSKGAHPNK